MIQIMIYSLLALVLAVAISKAGKALRAYDSKQRANKPRPLIDDERGYINIKNLDFFK